MFASLPRWASNGVNFRVAFGENRTAPSALSTVFSKGSGRSSRAYVSIEFSNFRSFFQYNRWLGGH